MTASDRCQYVPPTPSTIPVFEEVRACFVNLVEELDELLPECREKALVLPKLEEALSWANSAVARSSAAEELRQSFERIETSHENRIAGLSGVSVEDLRRLGGLDCD